MRYRVLLGMMIMTPVWALASSLAYASPEGGVVVGGHATINGQGTGNVLVNQHSDRAIINWNRFSIGAGESTRFIQPNTTSIAYNRVMGADPSVILGHLSANGQIILSNANGIIFGNGSRVDAAGLVATTHDMDNNAFMDGGALRFHKNPNAAAHASVVNEGTITIHDAGMAAFVAPSVRNSGVIIANLGTVTMGASNGFTVDMYGDKLVSFKLEDQIADTLTDGNGTPVKALVDNSGSIQANQIVLSANTAREVINQAVRVTGSLAANSVSQKGGQIILSAGNGSAHVSGTISAKGKTGGTVKITGEKVVLQNAKIDVSGTNGGGTIRVGGGYKGGEGIQSAKTTLIDASTSLKADAIENGKGGNVVVWSDDYTKYEGTISAKGGALGGNGGDAEVSGKAILDFNGTANLTAVKGLTGTLLLDPQNITIQTNSGTPEVICTAGVCTPTGDASILTVAALQAALANSNVTVTTGGTTGALPGNITVANNITWDTAHRLTLDAHHSVIINGGVTIKNNYAGVLSTQNLPVLLVLRADATGINNGGRVTNNGIIDFSTSTGAVSMFYDRVTYGGAYTAGSQITNSSWVAPSDKSLSSQFQAYQLINTVADISAMGNNSTGLYALGKNIDGQGTVLSVNTLFNDLDGILDGQYCALSGSVNCSITNLTLNNSGGGYAGLMGRIGANGIARNLSLSMNIIRAYNGTSDVGMLAGQNSGLIANVGVSGNIQTTLTGAFSVSQNVGGLVGYVTSTGRITGSTSSTNVNYVHENSYSSGISVSVGGLVGRVESINASPIFNSSASGNVTANYGSGYSNPVFFNVGGLVGRYTVSTGSTPEVKIENTSATGNVSVSLASSASESAAGGLIGYLRSYNSTSLILANSNSSGNVNYNGNVTTGSGNVFIGGLAGYLSAASIKNSATHTGKVSAISTFSGSNSPRISVGGLIGEGMTVSLNDSHSSMDVEFLYRGTSSVRNDVYIGGLAGAFYSSNILDSYATGDTKISVDAGYSGNINAAAGGLIGQINLATNNTLSGVHSTGNVHVDLSDHNSSHGKVGGLIGSGWGTGSVTNMYSTGDVFYSGIGGGSIGGLFGTLDANISQAYKDEGTVSVIGKGTGTYNIGGLFGSSSYVVQNSNSKIDVEFINNSNNASSQTVNIGGLIGRNSQNIDTSYATGNVSIKTANGYTNNILAYIGGLIGEFSSSPSKASNIYATGNVTSNAGGTVYMGGLIGTNSAYHADGLSDIWSSGDVVYTGTAGGNIGGLIGRNSSGAIKNATTHTGLLSVNSTGNASSIHVGGLIGNGGGAIQSSTSSRNISYVFNSTTAGTRDIYIGGLVGGFVSGGTITNSSSTGNVTVEYRPGSLGNLNAMIGGLVGSNGMNTSAVITNSHAAGNVNVTMNDAAGIHMVGGLVGKNDSNVTNSIVGSHASGDVNYSGGKTFLNLGHAYLGGLVGNNLRGNIVQSYSNGAITGTSNASGTFAHETYMGGLVGRNDNTSIITGSYSTSNVRYNYTGNSTGVVAAYLGGLTGFNNSISATSINNSYAMGMVSATGLTNTNIGGLVGRNGASGRIQTSYATGYLQGSSAAMGGLIGNNLGGLVTNAYWDVLTTGQASSAGGTGVTTSALQAGLLGGFGSTDWAIISGISYPYLKSQIVSGTPQIVSGYASTNYNASALAGAKVLASMNGALLNSSLTGGLVYTGANGYYYYFLTPDTIAPTGSHIIAYLPEAIKANAFAENITGSVSNLNLYGNYLNIKTSNASLSSVITHLQTALGSQSGADFIFDASSGDIVMNSGRSLALSIGADFTIDKALSTSSGGSLVMDTTHQVSQTAALNIDHLFLTGTGGRYNLTHADNEIGILAANTGSISLRNKGELHIANVVGSEGIITSGATSLVVDGDLVMFKGITAGGGGTSIQLVADSFTNNYGQYALYAGAGGRYLVWTDDPSQDNRGGVGYDFKQYNATYGTTAVAQATGNGFLYTLAPTLNVTLTGTVGKTYDGTTGIALDSSNFTTSGGIDGDILVYNLPTTGDFSNKNAGSGKTVTASGISVTATDGSANVYGYDLASTSSAAIGSIAQAEVTIDGTFTAKNKPFDGNVNATILSSALGLLGAIGLDDVFLAERAQFDDSAIGTGKQVTLASSFLSGNDAGNYILSYAGAPVTVADITVPEVIIPPVTPPVKPPIVGNPEIIKEVQTQIAVMNPTDKVMPYYDPWKPLVSVVEPQASTEEGIASSSSSVCIKDGSTGSVVVIGCGSGKKN